jgi:hypothetical protein
MAGLAIAGLEDDSGALRREPRISRTSKACSATSDAKCLKQPRIIVCSRRLDDPDVTGRKLFRVKQNIPSVRHDS